MEYILSTVCTGIGSPEQAAAELSEETGLKHKIGFYCEINKYARASYEANFEAGFMVEDMTKEEWDGPEFYSDIIVGGIPCQSFSLAGLRKGELDPRGLLFYDYYRYVKKQKPKAFIIENVKGLLSDANGKTFQNWLHLLGQSVNGHHQMFNSPDSLPYNLHWTVLNTKDFGVPQNRERVFLVGIRDDIPNTFRFPATEPLKLTLKDILEPIVDEKYYLSDRALEYLTRDSTGKWSDRLSMLNKDTNTVVGCITANHSKGVPYNMIEIAEKINDKEDLTQFGNSQDLKLSPFNGLSQCLSSGHFNQPKILIGEPSLSQVGDIYENGADAGRIYDSNGIARTIKSEGGGGGAKTGLYLVNDVIQLNPSKESGGKQPYQQNRVYDDVGLMTTLDTESGRKSVYTNHRIRRLTPLECWRLQGFPDANFYKAQAAPMSDSQLYKQAGNSMTTNVIKGVLRNILKCIFETA